MKFATKYEKKRDIILRRQMIVTISSRVRLDHRFHLRTGILSNRGWDVIELMNLLEMYIYGDEFPEDTIVELVNATNQ